jgi:CubicO group peptidase (beta-lactamase class C family)
MKRRQFILMASATAVASARSATASPQIEGKFDELAKLVSTRMADLHIPGVAFGVMKNGQLTTRGFGVTNIEDPLAVTADTVFPIASISKTVAAAAIMNLVNQGRVEVNAPVQRYLPDFRVADEKVSKEVQIWHLLTHTPGWEGQLNTDDRGLESLNVFTAAMKDKPQLAAPGAVWSYNNAGFGVAGRVIEVVTGKTIHDALRELVFAPAGMARAFSRTGEAMTYRFAAPHRQQQDKTVVIRPFELPANTTAGGVATTVSDLLKYAAFHLNGGNASIPRPLVEQMRTPQMKKNSTDDEIGLGWQLRRLNGVLTAAHGGTLGGHCLHLQLVPERNFAFSILTNHADGWRLIQAVERAALQAFEGLTLAPNQPIGHRGVSEDMTGHAKPLAQQPAAEQYAGKYLRPPVGSVEVREQEGKLVVSNGNNQANVNTLEFYGKDIAYVAAGPAYVGTPYEFIRKPDGAVGWIRINGRIAYRA